MATTRELLPWVQNLGGRLGIHTYIQPAPEDYLMFQGQDGIPLYLAFDPLKGDVRASAKVANKWSVTVHAAAGRLRTGELLELQVVFSDDGAEVWLAGSLLLHFPMTASPRTITKVFGTASFTHTVAKEIGSPAPDNRGQVATSLRQRKREPASGGKLIYDIGMGDAHDTDFYLRKGFSVVAVEPNPAAVARAARRFKTYLANGSLTLLNMAVSNENNRYPFFMNLTVPAWSAINRDVASRKYEVVELSVQVATLSDMIEAHGAPYYIKLSSEGFDTIALSTLAAGGELPEHISVTPYLPVVDKLIELGYMKMKLVNLSTIPMLRSTKLAQEGVAVDFKFGPTSFGPFGNESPGVWLSSQKVRSLIQLDQANEVGEKLERSVLHAAR